MLIRVSESNNVENPSEIRLNLLAPGAPFTNMV